ncbi:BCL10 [Branchiostoma lanceolatum]|uniref:BCL10 protein n=1 Tax=Branchiostoma lanceolatum TaxID=7740 RepID=A0A8K0EQR7_BRALA|nr:BCL10 [Branchiostoma lanceolatum]
MAGGGCTQEFDDEEEYYHVLKKEVLENLRSELCDNRLEFEKLLPYLRSQRTLDRDAEEIIERRPTSAEKISKFIDLIQQGGPNAFDTMCEAMTKKRTQVHLVTKLLKEFDRIKADPPSNLRLVMTEGSSDAGFTGVRVVESRAGLPVPGAPGGPSVPSVDDNVIERRTPSPTSAPYWAHS